MSIDIQWLPVILLTALAVDLALGEPPLAVHLTVWIGKTIEFFSGFGLAMKRPAWQFVYGVLISLVLITFFGGVAYALLNYLHSLSIALFIIASTLILKTTFCLKASWQLSLMVRDYLKKDAKATSEPRQEIRFLLGTVEFQEGDTREPHIVSSTIRSLAENASDFLVAPLFFYLILGVPGAVAYRVVNTLDGMIGHRGEYEYLGKFAAWLDMAVNFIPSRLTAFLLWLAAVFAGSSATGAWKVAFADHSQTESPNAGWPMATVAGALEVKLERAGYYSLGKRDKPLTADAITRAVRLFQVMALLLALISLAALFAFVLLA